MSYGVQPRAWRLGEQDSRPFIRRAIESGINFFDTADMYGGGESEEVLGHAIADFARRDEVVIATKLYYPVRADPNGRGLSRKAIFNGVDASLKRLRTDHVDLCQVHRWDDHTPIEETLEALRDVVKAGKARHLDASSMHAWQFCKAPRSHGRSPLREHRDRRPERGRRHGPRRRGPRAAARAGRARLAAATPGRDRSDRRRHTIGPSRRRAGCPVGSTRPTGDASPRGTLCAACRELHRAGRRRPEIRERLGCTAARDQRPLIAEAASAAGRNRLLAAPSAPA
jgi:hypothetical protein